MDKNYEKGHSVAAWSKEEQLSHYIGSSTISHRLQCLERQLYNYFLNQSITCNLPNNL